MYHMLKRSRIIWLLLGLALGLTIGGLWPETPLKAVATDRTNTFAMATGPLDAEVEAVFFLDFLTGDLRAAVPNRVGQFNVFFDYNVMQDLEVAPGKRPQFLLATGIGDLQRRGSSAQYGRTIVYVAEVTTGNVAAYGVPWNPAVRNSTRAIRQELIPLDRTKFRTATPAGLPGGAPAGPLPPGP